MTNYAATSYLFAERWILTGRSTIFFRLPGQPPEIFYYFPSWWFFLSLPLFLFGIGMLFPGFRNAIIAPWRQIKTALPLLITLAFLIFSLHPWDFLTAKQHETGSQFILYLALASAGFILLLTGTYPLLSFLDRPLNNLYRWLIKLPARRFLLIVTATLFLTANLISYFVFEHLPHIQDSISQLFQARIFATGRIHLPSPPFPDFFDYTHIINNGNWYSQYPWLHSFIILIFLLLGIPWITNPVLGALTVPAVYLLGREIYDEKTARLGAILTCLSPFVFNMSAEYMNHASALLFATLFLLFYFRTIKNKKPLRNALLAGICLGLVANIRPYTALAIATPFALYSIYLLLRQPRRHLAPFAILLISTALITSLVLVYNWLANGHPLLFGYVVKWGPGHEVGFGHSGWGPPHTPQAGFLNLGNNLNLINKFLFELPFPGLLLILIPFALPTRDRHDWLLLLCFLSLLIAYFFYWFHNVCFGPRFLYESSACLLLLTARGIILLPQLLTRNFKIKNPPLTAFFSRAFALSILFLFTVALPPLFKTYHTYSGVSAVVHKTVRRAGLKNALVFCDHFGTGFSYNRLDLQGDIVYAKDYGYLNAALTLAYPNRRYYFAKADTLRELKDIAYENSRLKKTLDELARVLTDTALVARYKTILWPFADIPPLPDTSHLKGKLFDYRQVSREIFMHRHTLHDYTPALAIWLFDDPREHISLFSMMDDPEHFLAAGFKFTLRKVSGDNLGAIYEIREQ